MMPLFFFWNASNDPEDIRQTGIGNLGRTWKAQRLSTCCIGVIYVENAQARIVADSLHPSLMTFPGPNGNLKHRHANHLAKEFPKAKAGDGFRGILAFVYAQLDDEHFNPDNF